MGRLSVSSKDSDHSKKDRAPKSANADTDGRKDNPQKALNDFLADPQAFPDSKRYHDGLHETDFMEGRSRSSSRHTRKSSDGNEGDEYDYEMQDYWPQPITSRGRSKTSYIPQYTISNASQFQIHEVVPNTQMAISSSTDTTGGVNGSLPGTENARSELRPRGQTVSSNLLHLGDIFKNNEDTNSHNASTSGPRSRHGSESHRSNVENSYAAQDVESDPRNVPMMVKPKTLYQNPQTPTVLPSTYHPINKWSTVKHSYLKEFLAEFMGTMVMVFLGSAVVCQVVAAGKIQQNQFNEALADLNNVPEDLVATTRTLTNIVSSVSGGTFDDIAFGWAGAVVMGYFCAGGSAISGAHLNPSITLSNFIFRGFPAKKIPYYFIGQLAGGFAGALTLFIFYKKVIQEAYDEWWKAESVASMFCVFPKPYLSSSRQFVSEFICTAVLQASTFALTDPYTCLSSDIFPLLLFVQIYVINASMSYQTGAAMNMARDLGPRLALYAIGFDRTMLWVAHRHFFWVPMVAPFLGSMTGALIYDVCIYQGHESPVNWPLSVYKDMILRAWFRRPGWKKRNRGRATSDLSDFSYEDDDDDNQEQHSANPLTTPRTRTLSSASDIEEPRQKAVQFKSVQGRGKRYYGGVPTILEDEDSIATASLGDATSDSVVLSDASSSLDDHDIKTSDQHAYRKKK
ncbi:hypothetical protein HG536_0A01790 [Torulaspora globosa]|uniref:Uncharacterized protein n=1 Tax=Torulaspora globosa TaxID=48254 RepID=A0A7G3ZA26_9SACH|nr:uncharacterized protein HG536_0A01790 [Torulaspora globosa]QLL30362.1 hypothetical protein HG536_0A01790 [Torulaspora globosa]